MLKLATFSMLDLQLSDATIYTVMFISYQSTYIWRCLCWCRYAKNIYGFISNNISWVSFTCILLYMQHCSGFVPDNSFTAVHSMVTWIHTLISRVEGLYCILVTVILLLLPVSYLYTICLPKIVSVYSTFPDGVQKALWLFYTLSCLRRSQNLCGRLNCVFFTLSAVFDI